MTPRTSIIMPVHRTGGRVIGAIRSALAQTDPDFELLVLIDGSPEDSRQVRAFLAEHPDERVRVFDDEQNRGVSAVRNRGLDEARGEWICFLDADDRFRPHYLATLHAFAADQGADVAACGHTLVRTTGEEQDRFRTPAGVLTGRQAAVKLLRDEMTSFVWDKLLRRDTVGDIRFLLDVHRGEDTVFCAAVLTAARRVVVVPSSLYEYGVGAGSLTWGRVTPPEESLRLMHGLARAVGDLLDAPEGRRAYTVTWVLIFLNAAQQSLMRRMLLPRLSDSLSAEARQEESAQALAVIRDSRRRITWRQLAGTASAAPLYAAGGALLKLSPALYRLIYGSYVRRTYGL